MSNLKNLNKRGIFKQTRDNIYHSFSVLIDHITDIEDRLDVAEKEVQKLKGKRYIAGNKHVPEMVGAVMPSLFTRSRDYAQEGTE